ncbi:serine/threonine-protein kinase [Nocardiopsis sp. LOL_012]|uniref:serine/threonine-protein kinase n=1 Tax=Nocardiopsis sp. LOL_012 TaxID=3345409 RepID=UPI003A899EC7
MGATMTTPLTPSDPTRIGPYTITARISGGGQGMVYLGETGEGSPAAVKVLASDWGEDARQRARFAQELEAARRVAPFCTAAVLDADMDADVPYIASEYVPGPTLLAAVREEGPREGAALDRLAIATVTALTAVHGAGVVHRDFKPGNVILGPDGPRVIDFGIARVDDATRHTTGIVGTPAYMSPEQVRGAAVGPASDLFAWASVMVFAATGSRAFPGESTMEVVSQVVEAEPDLTAVPERLLPVLARCLAKDPAARPSAAEVLAVLLGHGTGPAPVEATTVMEQASTAVDDGTAVISPVAAGWGAAAVAGTALLPAQDGDREATRAQEEWERTEQFLYGGGPGEAAGAGGGAPASVTRTGASPLPSTAGIGKAATPPAGPPTGVPPVAGGGGPADTAGFQGHGGRHSGRRGRRGPLAGAGALVVLAALAMVLLWNYGGGLISVIPTGSDSTPEGTPVDASSDAVTDPATEEPSEGGVHETPTGDGWTDCAAHPEAPECAPTEDPGCDPHHEDCGTESPWPTEDPTPTEEPTEEPTEDPSPGVEVNPSFVATDFPIHPIDPVVPVWPEPGV